MLYHTWNCALHRLLRHQSQRASGNGFQLLSTALSPLMNLNLQPNPARFSVTPLQSPSSHSLSAH